MIHGDSFSIESVSFLLLTTFVAAVASLFNKARCLQLYDTQQVVESEQRDCEALLSLMCDGLLQVADDGDTVLENDKRCAILERVGTTAQPSLGGVMLTEMSRLQEAFHHALTGPSLLHCKLFDVNGHSWQVDFYIVKRGKMTMQTSSCKVGQHGFLVGLCAHGSQIRQLCQDIDLPDEAPGAKPRRSSPSEVGEEAISEVASVKTPATCDIFGSFYEKDGMIHSFDPLDKLIDLGVREHWFIQTVDFHMMTDDVLGSGSFGVVVGGVLLGTPVAIKTTHDADMGRGLAQLANEIRVLRRVRHPQIVLFHGAFLRHGGCGALGLIFERICGRPLELMIKAPPLEPCGVYRHQLILDVCAALRYLHGQVCPVVHGDLKASNIMVDTSFIVHRAKLLDFGLSRILAGNARKLGGTMMWMAPEIILGQRTPDTATDVFSCGSVINYVMSGHIPRSNLTRCQIKDMARRGEHGMEVPSNAMFYADTCSICQSCWNQNPQRRPPMQLVHEQLQQWDPQDLFSLTYRQRASMPQDHSTCNPHTCSQVNAASTTQANPCSTLQLLPAPRGKACDDFRENLCGSMIPSGQGKKLAL